MGGGDAQYWCAGFSLHQALQPSASSFGLENSTWAEEGTRAAVLSDPGSAGVALVLLLAAPPAHLSGARFLALSGKAKVTDHPLAHSVLGRTCEHLLPDAKTAARVPAGRWLLPCVSLSGRETVTEPAAGTRRAEAGGTGTLRMKPFLPPLEPEPPPGSGGRELHCGLGNLPSAVRPWRASFLLRTGSSAHPGPEFPTQKSDLQWAPGDTAGQGGVQSAKG